MNEIEELYRDYQHQHRKKRINWDCGLYERKSFDEFVESKFWGTMSRPPIDRLPLGGLIKMIRKEYRCSYFTAYYKLMEWVKQHSEEFEIVWIGHTRHKVIQRRE